MQPIIDLRNKIELAQTPKPEDDRPGAVLISWTGLLYYHEPDMRFVWAAAGLFFALAVIVQVFQKNIITTILMAAIGLMIIFQAKRKHANVGEIVLSPLGVKVGGNNYAFSAIKSFWIDYQPGAGIEELSIQFKKWHLPYIRLPIAGQDPVRIRAFLIKYIPEAEHEITISELVARKLGL